jgi:RHS repeat-associated protein
MSSVTLPGTGGTVSFKYDPFGRRIYKSSSTTTSVYAYDGDNLVEETNSTGGVVACYEQTQNVDEPLAMLRSAATSYYDADGLGSVTSLSNTAGALAQTYGYDSFGKQTSSSGSLTNPFQYTARESDTETGLYYYRARYYDPNPGRFISEDPIRFASGTTNFYAYVGNDPVDESDPFGLCPPDKQCFAQLKCRTVNDWRALGRQHCFWYVQGSSGIQYILGAGPNPPTGNNRMLNIWPPNPNTQTGVDNRGASTAFDSGLSTANCSGVDAMIAAANGWPQNTIPYHEVTGPNSDTAAHYLGTQGGFNPPAPAGVIGWNTPLPPRPTPTPH